MNKMSPEKKWVKSGSRGKKKTQAHLKNKATWVLHNHSHSIMAKYFPLYIVVVLTLRVPHLYIFHIFYSVFELFLHNFCPVIPRRTGPRGRRRPPCSTRPVRRAPRPAGSACDGIVLVQRKGTYCSAIYGKKSSQGM